MISILTTTGAYSRVRLVNIKRWALCLTLKIAVFIRGLHEVFQRSASNNNLRILIHSYVDVQYNALLDLAANGASYGVVWHGPYNGQTSWGQNAAVDILVAAIGAN